jgi:hypothetical protein
MGIMDVFDDVSHRDRIEGHVVETGALQLTLMHIELSGSRAAYCDWVCFNARDPPAEFAHQSDEIAPAAADIEQRRTGLWRGEEHDRRGEGVTAAGVKVSKRREPSPGSV